MSYSIMRSIFTGQWLVINNSTQLAQSSWADKRDAKRVATDLNKAAQFQTFRSKCQKD